MATFGLATQILFLALKNPAVGRWPDSGEARKPAGVWLS
jgi:hypothetical protein